MTRGTIKEDETSVAIRTHLRLPVEPGKSRYLGWEGPDAFVVLVNRLAPDLGVDLRRPVEVVTEELTASTGGALVDRVYKVRGRANVAVVTTELTGAGSADYHRVSLVKYGKELVPAALKLRPRRKK